MYSLRKERRYYENALRPQHSSPTPEHQHQAILIFDIYARRLAKSLASVINIIDPEVIVLGGGMSNIDYLYQRVPEILAEYVFSDQVLTRLVKADFGDSSGVRGAARLKPTT